MFGILCQTIRSLYMHAKLFMTNFQSKSRFLCGKVDLANKIHSVCVEKSQNKTTLERPVLNFKKQTNGRFQKGGRMYIRTYVCTHVCTYVVG
jgi:hypothetical protein